jgi:dTDP-4-dehydrorhamnose reductase
MEACDRTRVSPTFVPDLCHATLDLLIDGETGIRHLANQSELSWYEFACRIAQAAALDTTSIVPLGHRARVSTALGSERGMVLRPLEPAIHAYVGEVADTLRLPVAIAAE